MPPSTPGRSAGRSRRSYRILAAAAIVALGVVAAACANGDLAAPTPEGAPRLAEQETQHFDNAQDAFRFSGFEFLEPDPTLATLAADITVRKLEAPTTDLVTVRAVYGSGEGSIEFTIDHPEISPTAFRGDFEEISIRGEPALLQRGLPHASDLLILTWSEDGITYQATTFTGDWSEEGFFEVIESMS